MDERDYAATYERIEAIETLEDYVGWIRDLSELARKDATIENPSTADYLETLSAFITDTDRTAPMEIGGASLSFKSMAQALYGALYYE